MELDSSELTHSRFLLYRFPEVDELVMVQVKQIQEMGAYVKLVRVLNTRPPAGH